MKLAELDVDFNEMKGGGFLRAYVRPGRTKDQIEVGDTIIVDDGEGADMRFLALVKELATPATNLWKVAKLNVDWHSPPDRRVCSFCGLDWTDWSAPDGMGQWSTLTRRVYCTTDCVVKSGWAEEKRLRRVARGVQDG